MKWSALVAWVDREWDRNPRTPDLLAFFFGCGFLPVIIFHHPVTIALGVIWVGFWFGLFASRWPRHIRKLDARYERSRRRRRKKPPT